MHCNLNRRAFLGAAGVLGVGPAVLGPVLGKLLRPNRVSARPPVVAIFNDQPYLDISGRAEAYIPPARFAASQPGVAENLYLLSSGAMVLS